MLKHIVLLKWKPGTRSADIAAVSSALSALPAAIPAIRSYQHGRDAGIYRDNADYALVAEFNNAADLKAYAEHPRHRELMHSVIAPILESYQSIQISGD